MSVEGAGGPQRPRSPQEQQGSLDPAPVTPPPWRELPDGRESSRPPCVPPGWAQTRLGCPLASLGARAGPMGGLGCHRMARSSRNGALIFLCRPVGCACLAARSGGLQTPPVFVGPGVGLKRHGLILQVTRAAPGGFSLGRNQNLGLGGGGGDIWGVGEGGRLSGDAVCPRGGPGLTEQVQWQGTPWACEPPPRLAGPLAGDSHENVTRSWRSICSRAAGKSFQGQWCAFLAVRGTSLAHSPGWPGSVGLALPF